MENFLSGLFIRIRSFCLTSVFIENPGEAVVISNFSIEGVSRIMRSLMRKRLANPHFLGSSTAARQISINTSGKCEPSMMIHRPAGVRMGWSRNVIAELLPFTSELISVRGRPLENIAVAYCVTHPVMDIPDPEVGKIQTQRRVEDSWLEMILPFSDQSLLRESMVRSDGKTIRFGKLFEILDALAADVAYRHCGAGIFIVSKMICYFHLC